MATRIAKTESPALTLLTKDEIKSDQDHIRKSIVGLDQSVHNNAVQCLLHAEKHGDTSLMRRLIIDVLGKGNAATGYRTQGLINWMRKFSPCELKGDVINLTGTDGHGHKRPFKIEEANRTPFWSDSDNAERVAKPVFKDTVLSPINRAVAQIMAAAQNTVNGKPIDPSKPFYDGLNMDNVVEFAEKVKEMAASLPADETRAVRLAQMQRAELDEFIDANKGAVNPLPMEEEIKVA